MADIGQPGGWYFEVVTLGVTPGDQPVRRHFKVYEPDQARARELVIEYAHVGPRETCRPVKQLNIHEFAVDNIQPGQVKQHD